MVITTLIRGWLVNYQREVKRFMTFNNLSDKQHQVFEQIAIGRDSGHNYNIIKGLMRKGLIKRIDHTHLVNGRYFHYEIPSSVHVEWREWCSKQGVKND